jgi:transcription elongation factor GreA-like protein
MGHIREPKGVDFLIKSEPLTDNARKEIIEFIREYKKKSALKSIQKKAQIQKSEYAFNR